MPKISMALTYDDVLLVPQRSRVTSRKLVNLKTQITPKIKLNFPIISVNMDTVTGIRMAKAMFDYGGISFYPRFKTPKEQAADVKKILDTGKNVIPAVGIKKEERKRVKKLVDIGVQTITIDVAHGHLESCLNFVKYLKKEYKDLEIIAGVISTYKGARDLFEAGADAVRVGVGPGTICTTRKVTGCGVPQITATIEASKAAKEFGKIIITDGGTKTTGDIVKALAAGANAVVTGSQLAGTNETPAEMIEIEGRKYKSYNASTSKTEKEKQYRLDSNNKDPTYVEYVEGVESYVPYRGPVKNVLDIMDKGIRSGFSYCGAMNIKELHKNARFIQVTPPSIVENGHHGVILNGKL